MQDPIKCLIIGSGPAGYTAAIYAARANLSPVLYEGIQPGGQLTTTTEIENFPGYPQGINGYDMMEEFRAQALRFNTDIRTGIVTKVDFSKRPFALEIDQEETIYAETVIIATGASAKYLGLEDENKYRGMGVSACATCDGFFYKGLDVCVVGGGDTACEEACYLSTLCNKVYLIHRRDELRASKAMQARVLSNPKIEMAWSHKIHEIIGNELDGVTGVDLENLKTGDIRHVDLAGVFVAIGHKPNTDFLNGQVELDEQGYIKVQNPSSATNVPGVFAAGDVCDPHYRQAIVAAGKGCVAGMDVERFLQNNQ